MRFGRPEQFFNKIEIRLKTIDYLIVQHGLLAIKFREEFSLALTPNTVFYQKGLGNNIPLLTNTRELFFVSRELIDVYLGRISAATKQSGFQTPTEFLPFAKRLMVGDFDQFKSPIFEFLKINITYIFMIRKVRNQFKTNPSSAEFNFLNTHIQLRLTLPINRDEMELIPYLDINNIDNALAEKKISATYNLDELYPELSNFWKTTERVFVESFPQVV
jgi:hypothetical protein